MRTACGIDVTDGGKGWLIGHRSAPTREGGGWVDTGDDTSALPNLNDPATLGCIEAQVCEVWGPVISIAVFSDGCRIRAIKAPGLVVTRPTKAEALIAAREAAP